MQQEVVLAMLAKEPSHGYELRARLNDALGPLGDEINAGQIYVTLGRLEKAGLVATDAKRPASDRSERKVYRLTAAGEERVAEWVHEVNWPRPDLAEFHLKLIAAAAARLADPISHCRRPTTRTPAPVAHGAARRDGGAVQCGFRLTLGGDRAPFAGGPALARGL